MDGPVSSSSTLWATPSKEWVIPAKPKPGRKPKKEAAPAAQEDTAADAKGKRVQNRAAQRAFRERKQSQLAELQARVQQYEQGEIERNVALQNVAKRLKEENEKLRSENALLRETLTRVEEERDSLRESTRKRWREDSVPGSPDPAFDHPARKKMKGQNDLMNAPPSFAPGPMSYASSPASISSPETISHSSFSPPPSSRDTALLSQSGGLNQILDMITGSKTNLFETGGSLDTFDCGFCSETTPCVCRELALQSLPEPLVSPIHDIEMEEKGGQDVTTQSRSIPSPPATISSILDNLPAYQPPVPLRRRGPPPATKSVLFAVSSSPAAESSRSTEATCSGDPSNCLACADDAFGKAFCAAISKTVSSGTPCGDCPSRTETPGTATSGGCCGNPTLCGQDAASEVQPLTTCERPDSGSVGPATTSTSQDTIPCDDAWRQLKSHPNASFADLELLAEVVARRSKCTGPRVEIHPAPGSITPERGISPSILPAQLPSRPAMDNTSVLLTDPHAEYNEKLRAGGSFLTDPVAQDVVVNCGRSRIKSVQADGVRDALRFLDSKYTMS